MFFIDVKVKTNAQKDEVVGWEDGYLIVRLNAVPEKGKANEALIKLIARYYSVPKSSVELVSGAKCRSKRLRID